jgi:transcriptional regulator with XRE-family HTH domain
MISKRLRELRKQKKLSMQDVANSLGVTRASVSKWELGFTQPELPRLERLAELYEVAVGFILGELNTPTSNSYPIVQTSAVSNFSCPDSTSNIEYFPSNRRLSGPSFFVRIDNDIFVAAGAATIKPGSLVLVDTSQKPVSGDVVYVSTAKGLSLFAILNVIGEKPFFKPLTPEYADLLKGKLEVIGVALESVTVTDMRSLGQRLNNLNIL